MRKLPTDSASKKEKQQKIIHPSTKNKKKGRPSKADLARCYPIRSLPESVALRRTLRPLRRSRGLEEYEPYFYEYDEEEDEEKGAEQRKKRKKKLTVVLKLNRGVRKHCTDQKPGRAHVHDPNSACIFAASSLEDDCENGNNKPFKKRRINGLNDVDDEDVADDVDVDIDGDVRLNKSDDRKEGRRNGVSKSVESVPGTLDDSSLQTPLPNHKTLEFILHKLQKNDTYGVYAVPVDPKKLPDYHDIIEHPMDFGTIRKKLASGAYYSLEQFESDVFLICSNAMRYNAPETIYYKQACAIQELARKKFEKFRVNGRSEMELKSAQKIRSTSMEKRSMQKSMCKSTHEPVGSDFSSGATLANTGDTCSWPNATQSVAFDKSGSVDGHVMEGNPFLDENKHDKAEEFSAKGFQSKFGRKLFVADENRRSTFNTADQPVAQTESVFAPFENEMKQLVVVGLHADHSYARSLARFAATLGPVAWRVASWRIEKALPSGYKFGCGWVGEYEPLQTPVLSLENHSQRQPSHNTNSQHNTESKEAEETGEKSIVTQDSGPKTVQLRFGTVSSVEAISSSQRLNPSNSECKLGWFGSVSGNKPTVNDVHLQQQQRNSLKPNFSKSARISMKQREVNCMSSVIPTDASQKFEHCSQVMTSRSLEVVSGSGNVMQPIPFKQPEAPAVSHTSERASHSGNGSVRMADAVVYSLPNGRSRNNSDNTNSMGNPPLGSVSNRQAAGALSFFGHSNNEQTMNDPVKSMMMLSGKIANHPKSLNASMFDNSQVVSPCLTSQSDDSSAAAVAAKAWMSVGAQGRKPADRSLPQMQIATATLYNSTQELPSSVSWFHKDTPGSGGLQSENLFAPTQELPSSVSRFHKDTPGSGGLQSKKNMFATHSLPQHVHVSEDLHFQNSRPPAFPQLVATDLARFNVQSPWRGLVPQQRQKTDILPPDLNIGFHSPGSPGCQLSSSIQFDSQQPDLALQL